MKFITNLRHYLWNLNPTIYEDVLKRSSPTLTIMSKAEVTSSSSFSTRWPLYRILMYAYLIVAIFRWLLLAYVEKTGKLAGLFEYDVLMATGRRLGNFTFNTGLFCSPMSIFAIHFDYIVFIKRTNNVFRRGYDLMVLNTRGFLQENVQFSNLINLNISRPIESWRNIKRLLSWWSKPPANLHWSMDRLPYFPYISKKIRLQVLYVNAFLQWLAAVALVITAFSVTTFFTYYHFTWLLLPHVDSWLKYLIGIIDLLAICSIALHTIKILIFLLHLFLLLAFTYHYYLIEIRSHLNKMLQLVALKGHNRINQLALLIEHVRRQMITSSRHAFDADRYLISPLLLTSSISNFSIQLYFIVALYFIKTFSFSDRLLLWTFVVTQILIIFVGISPMLLLSEDLNSTGLIFGSAAVQLTLDRRYLLTKLKCLDYFERFHSLEPFTFTMGPVGGVSMKSLTEFILFYSGYLLFTFQLVEKYYAEKDGE